MSGLIFVAVALGWAGYLIPRAMLRADDRALAAPVVAAHESVASARVLPRTAGLTREALAAAASSTPVPVILNQAQKRALRVFRRDARLAARRRAVILSALMAGVVAVSSMAALGVVPGWSVAVPVFLALVWLITCRAAIRRAAADTERRLAALADLAPSVPASAVVAPVVRRPLADSAVAPSSAPVVAASVAESDLEDTGPLWQPLQVPLPLYIDAPVAPRRTVRAIDLAGAGVTSSGHSAADSEVARKAAADLAVAVAEEHAPQARRAG